MAIDVSAVSYGSGREALQLAIDGGGSIQQIASLLAREAEDHLNSSCLPATDYCEDDSYQKSSASFDSAYGWDDSSEHSSFLPATDYNEEDSCDHHTALEVAASAGHIDAVERLLAAGADPNAPVHELGVSALEAAAAQGETIVMRKLLEAGAHPDHCGKRSNTTPLIAAAAAGHMEICKGLLQSGADINILIRNQDNLLWYPVTQAAGETSSITLLELYLGVVENTTRAFDPDDLKIALSKGRQKDLRRLFREKKFLRDARESINYALRAAAKSGNMVALQRLLDADADIIGSEFSDSNAIAAAASRGQLEAMNKLLQTASDRNNLPTYAVTKALQSAVDNGNIASIQPLLKNGGDATRIDTRRAAAEGHSDVLKFILQFGASVEVIPGTNDYDKRLRGFTNLQLAASHGHEIVVELLLSNGAEIDEALAYGYSGGRGGKTPLLSAVANGHLAVAKQLIDAGADVNKFCGIADTPLQVAIRTGDTAMLELLLTAGAAVDIFTGYEVVLDLPLPGNSALSIAAEVNNSDLVARLLSMMPADVARQAAHLALQKAVENEHVDIVRQLLQLHPDVNSKLYPDVNNAMEVIRGVSDLTLLQMVAAYGNLEILEMLLSEGADVNLNPSEGRRPTALQSASERGDVAAMELLLAAGAEVNVTGSTAPPLLLAIRGGHAQVFERLLAAGADIHATAYRGQTMIEAAEDSGDADLQERVRAVLHSRPPPQIDQPLEWGTGPLCETCRAGPLREVLWGSDVSFDLHPSLTSLRDSAAAGCPFCCFLWKRLGPTRISMPRNSPVKLSGMSCYVEEPFPRDLGDAESLIIGFQCFLGFPDSNIPITEDTSSPETYRQIHTWLDTCKNEHPKCRAPLGKPSLPTRLIHLDTPRDSSLSTLVDPTLHPRLVSINDLECSERRYVALSYRWPEDLPIEAKTNQDNVREQMRRLNTSKLPQVFKDLFQVAVRMGISYVWIDSLCIIQDDPEDWNREAALMIQIYRNAEFTVAAAVPPTKPDLGLFRHGDPSDPPSVTIPGLRDPRDPRVNGTGRDVVLMKPQKEAYGESPLVSRGWCFQEREISQRIIHYTETQVLWECRTLRASECRPFGGVNGALIEVEGWTERMLDDDLGDWAWFRAVEDYSARHLTVFADKLPALAGLAAATRESRQSNSRYLAGLWEDNFLEGLQWSSRDTPVSTSMTSRKPRTGSHTRYPGYVAPTWSWASVAGPILYGYPEKPRKPNTAKFALNILDIDVQTSTNDPFGAVRHAVLTCTAGLLPGMLREIKRPGHHEPDYEVITVDGSMIGKMSFDVPKEKYDGEEVEIVFCIYLCGISESDNSEGPGLVVLPTGNRENEYRRVGMMQKMGWGCGFTSAEIDKITII